MVKSEEKGFQGEEGCFSKLFFVGEGLVPSRHSEIHKKLPYKSE